MLGNLSRVAPTVRSAASSRQMSVIAGPPRVRISFAEKCVHGVAIGIGMLTLPAWVMCNLQNYKNKGN